MKYKLFVWRLLFVWLGFLASAGTASAQFNYFDIKTANGRWAFAYNQAPDNLVSLNAGITAPAGYQWEQSTEPQGTFTPISGATNATYTFSAPLTQTTYFRRKFLFTSSVGLYSNTIRIEVVSASWENMNYIREHEVLVAGVTTWQAADQLAIGQKLQTTTYADGMGRPIQIVSKETATPGAAQPNLWGDVVQFVKYDAFGRVSDQYLQYTTTVDAGKYKSSPVTDQAQYYTNVYNETFPYNQVTYADNQLQRISNVKSAGTAWAAGSGASSAYELNDVSDDVQIFTIGYATGATPSRVGTYAAKTLYKTISTDEHGKQTIEYRNYHGQVILTKVQIDDNPSVAHIGWICTYSVYDDFGLLRYRIQPEGVKYLEANGWSFAGANGQKVLGEWCFRYEYDAKKRIVLKKAPGAKEQLMLYDKRDRLVFVQDGNQRTQSTPDWTTTLYDELDRPVLTTLYHTGKTVAALQTDIDNAVTYTNFNVNNPAAPLIDLVVDFRHPFITQYQAQNSIEFIPGFESDPNDDFVAEISSTAVSPMVTIPVATYLNPIPAWNFNNVTTTIKYFFYDSYSYVTAKNFSFSFNNTQAYSTGDPILSTERTTGFITGTMTRVLGTSTFLTKSVYYDDKGRTIQTLEDNLKSGVDIITTQYHFDGRVLSSSTRHSAVGTGYSDYGVLTKYLYDKVGRVNGIEKKYGTNAFKRIANYDYDDIGRLKARHLSPGYTGTGKNELEVLEYNYNLRHEITGINKDYALKTPGKYNKWGNFFGLYIGYDNRDGVFANANLRGQVAGTLWTTQGDDAQRKYDLSYDNSGRLINAIFNQKEKPADSWSNGVIDFTVTGRNGKIEYDLNGNLLYMLQKGVVPGSATPVTIDDLQYTYNDFSNRLKKVVDANAGIANGALEDFSDGSNGSNDDYVYDDNGNVVVDLNKSAKDLNNTPGAHGIRYNYLDKPEEIRIAGKGTIQIVYDADGIKLQKKYTPDGTTTAIVTTYIKEFVYKGDDLQYINTAEGRLRIMQPVNQNNGYDALSIDGNIDMPGGKRGAFDYFIRDYLGNVRMTLTEETHTGGNAATMETQRAANEEPVFGQVDANGNPSAANEVAARFPVANIPGQASGNGWQNSSIGNYVSRVGNLASSKIGPNALLKVMAGDQVSATSMYYYQNPVTNSSGGATLVTDLLVALSQTIAGSPVTSGLAKGAASSITSPLSGSAPFTSIADPDASNASGSNPKAYLAVLFFDERFNFVSEGSISLRVSQSGSGASPLVLANIKAPKNGYAYVYVANESDEMVYFDNLQVAHERGRIIEENHYYAFGLRVAGISSRKMADPGEGHVDNKYMYNDKEIIDEADIDWYDYGFRNYDAQIGRFTQLDPLTDYYAYLTPYQYASNDPITNIDLDGLEGVSGVKAMDEVVVVGYKAAKTGSSTISWMARITAISTQGALDAWANASLVGIYEIFGTNLSDYDNPFEQKAYLRGRLIGDLAAILQGISEINIGGGTALLTGVQTGGIGAAVGLGIAAHGAAMGGIATADVLWTLKKLYNLYMSGEAGGDIGSSSSESSGSSGSSSSEVRTFEGFEVQKGYSYTAKDGQSFYVTPHAYKHMEELATRIQQLGPKYMKLIGKIYQESIHSAINDVISRGPIKYREMYFSGGNEIMFDVPRNPGELPSVIHFMQKFKQ